MVCWPQTGAESELLGSGGSMRQLCPSRLQLQAKDLGHVGHVKRGAKRDVACSVECEHEHCKGIGSVSRACHSKSLNVANTRKKALCCCASWHPPRGESSQPSTQRCGSLAMQAGPSPVIRRTQDRALWQGSVQHPLLRDRVSFP